MKESWQIPRCKRERVLPRKPLGSCCSRSRWSRGCSAASTRCEKKGDKVDNSNQDRQDWKWLRKTLPWVTRATFFCITSLPQTSATWVGSTFKLLHCPHSQSSAAVDKSRQHRIRKKMGIEPETAGWETRTRLITLEMRLSKCAELCQMPISLLFLAP